MIRPMKASSRHIASAALLSAATALLAGCTGVTTYRSEAAGNPNLQIDAPFAAMNGSILAIIRNNPFPTDPAGQQIVAIMSTNNPMQRYRFALVPQPDWNGYSVVLAFGQTPVGNVSLCQNTMIPPRPMPPGRTAVVANLCFGPTLITEVWGRAPEVTGPDDPTFAALIGGVLQDLFALRQPRFPRPRGPMFRW